MGIGLSSIFFLPRSLDDEASAEANCQDGEVDEEGAVRCREESSYSVLPPRPPRERGHEREGVIKCPWIRKPACGEIHGA